MPALYVVKGWDQGSLFDIDAGKVSVGRDTTNQICLHDYEVSRRHAELCYDGSVCLLDDLESPNGTFVNDHPIGKQHPLVSGDRIQIGATVMLYIDPERNAEDVSGGIIPYHPRSIRF